MSARPEWQALAACAGSVQPELWDDRIDGEAPEKRLERHAQARRICARCPVRDACLVSAVPGADFGIRGGRLFTERRYDPAGVLSRACPDCGRYMRAGNVFRHRRLVHRMAS